MAKIVLTLEPNQADLDALLAGLKESSAPHLPRGDWFQPVGFFVDEDLAGQPKSGLSGHALFDWLYVEFLYVSPGLRGGGVGSELVAAAEEWARQRGLVGMWLQTMEFQARSFYEKCGFSVFATIPDMPVGSATHYMQKRF